MIGMDMDLSEVGRPQGSPLRCGHGASYPLATRFTLTLALSLRAGEGIVGGGQGVIR